MAGRKGQSTVEFILAFGAILLPMTFMLIFVSQLLWVWHSVNEFTREGASYASSHCWESSGQNVVDFMRANVPPMVMGDQVQSGPAHISVAYFSQDDTGQLGRRRLQHLLRTRCRHRQHQWLPIRQFPDVGWAAPHHCPEPPSFAPHGERRLQCGYARSVRALE